MRVRRKLGGGALIAVLALFLGLVILTIALALAAGRPSAKVRTGRTYYVLVRECEASSSAAVLGQVYSAGGAGYLTEDGVVVACYYLLSDAERAESLLSARGVGTTILTKESREFRLEGDDASLAARVQANGELADVCSRMLFESANGLELGKTTQEEARAAVRGVQTALCGLRTGNVGKMFSRWNDALERVERGCAETASGILFSKDLRRLQAELLFCIIELDSYFS